MFTVRVCVYRKSTQWVVGLFLFLSPSLRKHRPAEGARVNLEASFLSYVYHYPYPTLIGMSEDILSVKLSNGTLICRIVA